MPNQFWCVQTGRLDLRPVAGSDLPDLVAIKADPRSFALLLGGVRNRQQATEELAADIAFWGQHRVGMWAVRERRGQAFVGVTGIMGRSDGRGLALRFALTAHCWGKGYASEAASAALRFAHERAGLARVVAVARGTNMASREVLAAIGMNRCQEFMQHGHRMLLYESLVDAGAAERRIGLTPPAAAKR